MKKPVVVIGLLGPVLDQGRGVNRWERWRPTVSICQHDDLLVSRFELLHQRNYIALAETLRDDIGLVSPETTVRLHECQLDRPWDFEVVYGCLLDWARAYPFKPEEEDYLVHITTGTHVAQICLFLLAESRYLPGRLLQTSPPRRELPGAGAYEVIDLDLSRYDRIAARFRHEQTESLSFLKSGIETRNEAFNGLIERIERVAIHSAAPLLLMGPTGAGKSKLARRIYELKKTRRQVVGDFVEVNCATVRGDGAMSALFGHKKGAFTGALADRQGLLRAADRGMLFLDEIGELALDEQAMLLRALEEKRFLPVGSDKEATSDFQLIAGTNRDLIADVRHGRFRDDLFARINLWTFALPALRERPEDIEPNLDYELEQVARKTGSNVGFNREARERFLSFATSGDATWAGNFRDLNAAVTRMATLAGGGRISTELVADEIQRLRFTWGGGGSNDSDDLAAVLPTAEIEKLDLFDRLQLRSVIAVCQESQSLSDAGRRLFAASRQAKAKVNDADRLRKYLTRFGVAWADIKR
ncbi:MAG TPA: RNA repair transcriptional activator RtcR [Tepidisphaeraceae bacterium]|jgi:transcriptional regulatory protein RtcR